LASSCDDRLGSASEPVYYREQVHLFICGERGQIAPRNGTALLALPSKIQRYSLLIFSVSSAATMIAYQQRAAGGVRTLCFTKTMEKVPSANTPLRFTKIRGIPRLRYNSAQIGFSVGNQPSTSMKVAPRARFRHRCEGIAKNQLRRGFPVFKVCAMRSCVLRSPHRLTKASRSRSRTYCSGTSCGAVTAPPARMFASFRPTTPS
jgi:hypothetical protein